MRGLISDKLRTPGSRAGGRHGTRSGAPESCLRLGELAAASAGVGVLRPMLRPNAHPPGVPRSVSQAARLALARLSLSAPFLPGHRVSLQSSSAALERPWSSRRMKGACHAQACPTTTRAHVPQRQRRDSGGGVALERACAGGGRRAREPVVQQRPDSTGSPARAARHPQGLPGDGALPGRRRSAVRGGGWRVLLLQSTACLCLKQSLCAADNPRPDGARGEAQPGRHDAHSSAAARLDRQPRQSCSPPPRSAW